MTPIFQRLRIFSSGNKILGNLYFTLHSQHRSYCVSLNNQKPNTLFNNFQCWNKTSRFDRSFSGSVEPGDQRVNDMFVWIQNMFKFQRDLSAKEIEIALNQSGVVVTEELLLKVLRNHQTDWRPAFIFFNWASKALDRGGLSPGHESYNLVIDILGKLGRIEESLQLFDKMSQREGLVNEATYSILLNRLSAAKKVDKAIEIFQRRKEFGFGTDTDAPFQTLLMWLCRYKHVEKAEALFHSNPNKLCLGIKPWNIILHGWCVRGRFREAQRVWKDILEANCKPDVFTYGTYLSALIKNKHHRDAMRFLWTMWEKGPRPDVVICNSMIEALCYTRRVPEALEILKQMPEQGCEPNIVTHNTMIKYMCKLGRLHLAYEIFNKVEASNSSTEVTYNLMIGSVRKPEEVVELLQKMKRNGIEMSSNTWNLVLKVYTRLHCEERVFETWNEMEQSGVGLDQRSYTVMVHWLVHRGRTEDAARYFEEMKSKGMVGEPMTETLMNSRNVDSTKTSGKRG